MPAPRLLVLVTLVLPFWAATTMGAAPDHATPPASSTAAKSWYFRPQMSSSHQLRLAGFSPSAGRGPPPPPAAAGASYATAWTAVAAIDWAKISAGDTLFVCGLHDGGRLDGALNITKVQGSGVEGNPVTYDGRCVDDSGRADPGTLMAGKLITQSELGPPDAHGIFTYSYDSPAAANAAPAWWRRQQHLLGAGVGTGMANKPDILERPAGDGSRNDDRVPGGAGMTRLKHGDCNATSTSSVGSPVNPASWPPGTACYTGVWTN